LERIEEHFIPLFWRFIQICGKSSTRDHGFIKLLKISVGIIFWRLEARSTFKISDADFIFDTLRLAYAWGTTYPLVDNVLDSAQTDKETRHELVSELRRLFTADGTTIEGGTCTHQGVQEAVDRLAEVLNLVPKEDLSETSNVLLLLLEAHHRDSHRRLSSCRDSFPPDTEEQLWTDSVVKAALIRVATVKVCGLPLDSSAWARHLTSAVVNQFGDDMWDVYEDMEDDRLTPFTSFLGGLSTKNPFQFFVRYCIAISGGYPEKRRLSLLIAMQETLHCLLNEVVKRGSDPLQAVEQLRRVLAEIGMSSFMEQIYRMPHVDPDSVLFLLEHGLFDLGLAPKSPD
jgi:hypothetical protein